MSNISCFDLSSSLFVNKNDHYHNKLFIKTKISIQTSVWGFRKVPIFLSTFAMMYYVCPLSA